MYIGFDFFGTSSCTEESQRYIPVALDDDTTGGKTGEPSIPPLKHGPGERRASRRESHWHSQILRFPQKLPTAIPGPHPGRSLSYPLPTPCGPWLLAQALVLFRGLRPILIRVGVSMVLSRSRGTSKIPPPFASHLAAPLMNYERREYFIFSCIYQSSLLKQLYRDLFFS